MKFLQCGFITAVFFWNGFALASGSASETEHVHADLSMSVFAGNTSEIGIKGRALDFELVGHDGELVRGGDLKGKNVLLSFGFTQCANICPLVAHNMAQALKAADKEAVGVFISVDNERDTPEITHKYASYFGPTMIGLSGSYEQLSAAAMNFNVTFVVTKSPNSYIVQHSPAIFLMGPDGELIDVFAINSSTEDIAAAMK